MWLEDCIPLLREIYSYDSTYHEIFQKVVQGGAHVYLRANGSYFIIPCGLMEKVEHGWILMTLTLYRGNMLFPRPALVNWKTVRPRSLGIQYLYHRNEWKQEIRNRLAHEEMFFLWTMSRQDLENLYHYEFT